MRWETSACHTSGFLADHRKPVAVIRCAEGSFREWRSGSGLAAARVEPGEGEGTVRELDHGVSAIGQVNEVEFPILGEAVAGAIMFWIAYEFIAVGHLLEGNLLIF